MKFELIDINFWSSIIWDYDSIYNCKSYGCEEEGICRCREIVNHRVVDVNFKTIVYGIYSQYSDNSKLSKRNNKIDQILGDINEDINLYTIDRILRINKLYLNENWRFNITDGYYGQEIDEVVIIQNVAEKIAEQLNTAFSILNFTKRIEYILQLEYGYLLEQLKDKNYSILEVNRDDILFGNESHLTKLSTKNLDHYSDKKYSLIRGIAIQKGDKYKIIDGYHRCFKSENKTIKLLIAK
jgi:hypothetical protein